jgi:hypothetical protein
MVGKVQKSYGARSGLYGGCSNGVPLIHFLQAEHRIQFRSRPMRFLAFPTMKRELRGKNFEVINDLQHVFEKWVERCKKCIACQGRYFVKETVTSHFYKVPTRSNKVSPRTFQTALVEWTFLSILLSPYTTVTPLVGSMKLFLYSFQVNQEGDFFIGRITSAISTRDIQMT